MGKRVLGWVAIAITSVTALAAEPPASRPRGDYLYRGNHEFPSLRRATTVKTSESDYATVLSELRSQGFGCIKRSLSEYLCTRMEKNPAVPQDVEAAVAKGLEGMAMSFPGPEARPELLFDGAQTEWLYREPVQVRGEPVAVFKLVTYPLDPDGKRKIPQIIFPVSEKQPIPYADFLSERELAIHMILESHDSKEGRFTLGYFLDARLER